MSEQSLFSEALNSAGDIAKNLPEEVKNDIIRGPAQEIGTGLSNLMYVIFSPILKSRVKIEQSVKKMKLELEKSISNIPADNLVEPALNIVGPAIEGSKYHIEDDNVRNMFVRLISSASNADKVDTVHPSFVEIIKQLSPFDAQCLEFLVKERATTACGTIRTRTSIGSGFGELKYVFPFPGLNMVNTTKYISSVDNLMRLGIIECSKGKYASESEYATLISITSEILAELERNLREEYPQATVELVGNVWSFTQMGELFIESCIVEEENEM